MPLPLIMGHHIFHFTGVEALTRPGWRRGLFIAPLFRFLPLRRQLSDSEQDAEHWPPR